MAYDAIANHLYHELDVDTRAWSPRRFGLVRWVDYVIQDIYSALNDLQISGRDAAKLLEYLNDAVYYLYKPASAKHQIISLYNSDLYYYRKSYNRRDLGSSSCKKSHGDAQKAIGYLDDFLNHLSSLSDKNRFDNIVPSIRVNDWRDIVSSVLDNFPKDARLRDRHRDRALLVHQDEGGTELEGTIAHPYDIVGNPKSHGLRRANNLQEIQEKPSMT